MTELDRLSWQPAARENWGDLKRLFGSRGACGGCWCMWWRLSHSEYERRKGEANRRALKRLIDRGAASGILAYLHSDPVAWCSVAPRADFPRLARSRILRPVDDREVWSIVCLFIAGPYRRTGLSSEVIRAAARHAAGCGARVVEAYPVEPRQERMPDAFAGTGIAKAFRRAGFHEVVRRSETRPILRWVAPRKGATG